MIDKIVFFLYNYKRISKQDVKIEKKLQSHDLLSNNKTLKGMVTNMFLSLNKKVTAVIAAAVMLCVPFAGICENSAGGSGTANIVFTHDIHSHLDSSTIEIDGNITDIGGFSRLKSYIDSQKQRNPDTLVVDAGDFSMGTLYQTVFASDAAELRMLSKLGFDAGTLGNHEFEYGAYSLSEMLGTAKEKEETPMPLVICNIDRKASTNAYSKTIISALNNYGAKDYVMVKKGGLNIAVTGVFGKGALEDTPTCEMTFKDPIDSVKDVVATIKQNEKADLIVCVSHGGTSEDEKNSEDEQLAMAVPDLDVIISGHTHTKLNEPIVHGSTYIVSCGSYCEYAGHLELSKSSGGRWELKNYELVPLTANVGESAETQAQLAEFSQKIDEGYVNGYGYSKDDIIAYCPQSFETPDEMGIEDAERRMGNLVADSFRRGTFSDFGVIPQGVIRSTLYEGNITVSDAFNVCGIGSGSDGSISYPLVQIYLNGKEIRNLAEVDASVSEFMPTAKIYGSGFGFSYNKKRMLFNRVTDVWTIDGNGKKIKIDDNKLYSVAVDYYSCLMLSSVNQKSAGLLSIIPKDKNGTPIVDYTKAIVKKGDKEYKTWLALTDYLSSFSKNANGIPQISSDYSKTQGRKIITDDSSVKALLSNPNGIMLGVCGIVATLIILIIFVIVLIILRFKKRYR